MTDLLREEWNFKGMVMTDFFVPFLTYMNPVKAIYAQTDALLSGMGSMYARGQLYAEYEKNPQFRDNLELAVKNILTTVMQTKAFTDTIPN